MSRYRDLKALAQAFASGELDRNLYTLQMDSDVSYLAYTGPAPAGLDIGTPEYNEWWRQKEAATLALFRGMGTAGMVDACNAAGIPTSWA